MNFYYVMDEAGYLLQQGTFHTKEEKEALSQLFPNFVEGLPCGLTGFAKAPSPNLRWHVLSATWQEIPKSDAELWGNIRYTRDQLLAESDWIPLRALTEGRTIHPEWDEYRTALRNITEQPNPREIEWPVKPTATYFI